VLEPMTRSEMSRRAIPDGSSASGQHTDPAFPPLCDRSDTGNPGRRLLESWNLYVPVADAAVALDWAKFRRPRRS
jgi:hypothetical protein